MDINPIFNSRAIFKCNEVHVNEIKSAANAGLTPLGKDVGLF